MRIFESDKCASLEMQMRIFQTKDWYLYNGKSVSLRPKPRICKNKDAYPMKTQGCTCKTKYLSFTDVISQSL